MGKLGNEIEHLIVHSDAFRALRMILFWIVFSLSLLFAVSIVQIFGVSLWYRGNTNSSNKPTVQLDPCLLEGVVGWCELLALRKKKSNSIPHPPIKRSVDPNFL